MSNNENDQTPEMPLGGGDVSLPLTGHVLRAEAGTLTITGYSPTVRITPAETDHAVHVVKVEEFLAVHDRASGSATRRVTKPVTLSAVVHFCDLIPSPRLRKRLRKLLGDQQAHILELEAAGRHRAARWIRLCTWGLVVWQVVVAPAAALLRAVARSFGHPQ